VTSITDVDSDSEASPNTCSMYSHHLSLQYILTSLDLANKCIAIREKHSPCRGHDQVSHTRACRLTIQKSRARGRYQPRVTRGVTPKGIFPHHLTLLSNSAAQGGRAEKHGTGAD
jgi:hypothetical protein